MNYRIRLKIAGVLIQMESKHPLQKFNLKQQRQRRHGRFHNFFYHGRQKPQVRIKIEIKDKLPKISKKAKELFLTKNFDGIGTNWRLLTYKGGYIYKNFVKAKKQIMTMDKNFKSITVFLLPKNKQRVWDMADIVYDFLQILLINYFARYKLGIFAHAMGVKDVNKNGFLFLGESGAGKSTMARIWHKHTKAQILNDDRVIIRRENNGNFFIYGTPWHGNFSDYLGARMEKARLVKLFFIYHNSHNEAKRIVQKAAFRFFYPAIFPTFWDKEYLENIASLSCDLLDRVPCFRLGFVNDKNIIEFVRKK
ncbi:MAG: hypothetical protein V2A72_04305 [Candidatus Omnitrophota bacterium]